ncbi:hypothetical protein Ahy_B05g074779 [Arachis hypogaea]|uniref:Protein FAR1-RELATED SEQUENCE n=1 Tax=Arachis hypogaea TaxID=3818 RepID=A0A444YZR8_ARAHY|nr:hypothetical protein Ahy_B05g074779 [Arachis hypogaea]
MDLSPQLSGGEDDSDRLSEEEYFGVSSSSGKDDDDDSSGNNSELGETGDQVHGNGNGADLVTCEGDAPGFRSAEDFMDKVFNTEEEAYVAYKQFARLRGFGVRKGDVARVSWYGETFFYHRQGARHEKHYDYQE